MEQQDTILKELVTKLPNSINQFIILEYLTPLPILPFLDQLDYMQHIWMYYPYMIGEESFFEFCFDQNKINVIEPDKDSYEYFVYQKQKQKYKNNNYN